LLCALFYTVFDLTLAVIVHIDSEPWSMYPGLKPCWILLYSTQFHGWINWQHCRGMKAINGCVVVVCLPVKQTWQFAESSENSEGAASFTSTDLHDDGLQVCNTSIHFVCCVDLQCL